MAFASVSFRSNFDRETALLTAFLKNVQVESLENLERTFNITSEVLDFCGGKS